MDKILLGAVTKAESDELHDIIHWRNAIIEVAPLFGKEETGLREKAVQQFRETVELQNAWWQKISAKYKWEYAKDDVWHANTADGTIYLSKAALSSSQ